MSLETVLRCDGCGKIIEAVKEGTGRSWLVVISRSGNFCILPLLTPIMPREGKENGDACSSECVKTLWERFFCFGTLEKQTKAPQSKVAEKRQGGKS